jgi:hypothetical protein
MQDMPNTSLQSAQLPLIIKPVNSYRDVDPEVLRGPSGGYPEYIGMFMSYGASMSIIEFADDIQEKLILEWDNAIYLTPSVHNHQLTAFQCLFELQYTLDETRCLLFDLQMKSIGIH